MNAILSTRRIAVLAMLTAIAAVARGDDDIEEIVVTADLRERPASEVAASVSVIAGDDIRQLAVQHFEELVQVVPNLNWSGDGHRARYFQIRGVGELEQYQGAPNPSVGFLIDDIDYSGIGTIATLFDLERVEVLRGPQGTRYGANALAGLIYLRSAAPTESWDGRAELSIAEDDARSIGVALGGPLTASKNLLFRLSGHNHVSDGFRDNPFLGRDDTNGRDETSLRGRIRWYPGSSWQLDLSAMFSDIDNGYDAFALDNGYMVLSDKPGRDAQRSGGASLRAEWAGQERLTLTSITAFADSDIDFGFDADWGNSGSWAPFVYDFVSINDRARRTLSQELRLAGEQWLLGVYALDLGDELDTLNRGEYIDPFIDFTFSIDDRFDSDYDATSFAIFGEYEVEFGTATRLTAGLRLERRSVDYSDSEGLTANPSESMAGGELALTRGFSDRLAGYVSLSKGYKAGGFNLGLVPDDRREFSAEALWNLEVGVKTVLLNQRLRLNAALFASRREDQQVRTSFQLVPGDPASFVFFTDNAAEGETLGFEADLRWQAGEALTIYANVGLLDATFRSFVTPQVDLSGRDQAHAPSYTLALGGEYRHSSGAFARVDLSARDAFYFDVSHDQQSQAYELVNARVGYQTNAWTVQLWARNLFDEKYAVRGFFFGNEPPDFPNELYTRLGDPRQVGMTLERRF